MTASKSKRLKLSERRAKVVDLYLQGYTQHAIAKEVHSTQGTISKDLNAIRSQWLSSRIRNFDEAKEIELKKIDRLECEAWSAWKRSQEDAVTNKTMMEGGDAPKSKAERTVKGQTGDAKFLTVVRQCIECRCKLLGLDTPEKFVETDLDGNEIRIIEDGDWYDNAHRLAPPADAPSSGSSVGSGPLQANSKRPPLGQNGNGDHRRD